MVSLSDLVYTLVILAGSVALVLYVVLEFYPSTSLGIWLVRALSPAGLSFVELDRRRVFNTLEFALIERNIPRIKSVVVLSHRIDEPTRALHDAVLDNFQEGARYTFFVSADAHTPNELIRYKGWFRAIYDAAKLLPAKRPGHQEISKHDFEALFCIKTLPIAWTYVPYAFFTYLNSTDDMVTFALKGTRPGVGISPQYHRVPPTEANVILALCSIASTDLDEAIGVSEIYIEPSLPELAEDREPKVRLVASR